jgi:hypothetical protein
VHKVEDSTFGVSGGFQGFENIQNLKSSKAVDQSNSTSGSGARSR